MITDRPVNKLSSHTPSPSERLLLNTPKNHLVSKTIQKTPILNSNRLTNSSVTRGRAMLMAAQKATDTDSNQPSQVGSTPSSVLHQVYLRFFVLYILIFPN